MAEWWRWIEVAQLIPMDILLPERSGPDRRQDRRQLARVLLEQGKHGWGLLRRFHPVGTRSGFIKISSIDKTLSNGAAFIKF
jgi:hypothetical protein